MRFATPHRVSGLAAVGVLASCSAEPLPSAGPAASIAVRVAALELPGVADACYSLAVANEEGQPVWSQGGLCASRYGSGADIAYVAPCDATDLDGGGALNTVTLTVDGLSGVGGSPIEDFIDPCGAPYNPDGCQLAVVCRENADAPVVFNLTLMRQANQGFFDVAVSFSDIFCSAKVDCVDAESQPLQLVHDPESGRRVASVVLALACTDGSPPGAEGESTHLYREPIAIVCGGTTYSVDPTQGPGNVFPAGAGAPPPLVQAMVFEGVESLTNGGAPADKLYWNVALGLDVGWFEAQPDGTSCRLKTRMTASEGPLDEGMIAADASYPYITVDVPIWSTGAGAAPLCSRHPLNGEPEGVATAYTRPGAAPTRFRYVGAQAGAGFESALVTAAPLCTPDFGCQPGEVQLVSVAATGVIDQYSDLGGAPVGDAFAVHWSYDACAPDVQEAARRGQYVQDGPGTVAIWQFGALRQEGAFGLFLADDLDDSSGLVDLYELQSSSDPSTSLQLITSAPYLDFRTSERLECTGPAFDGLEFQTNYARFCDADRCAQGTITAVALAPLPPPPPPPGCDPACVHGTCVGADQCQCEPGYTGDTCAAPVCAPPCAPGACAAPGTCACGASGVGACGGGSAASWIRTFGSPAQDWGGQTGMLTATADGHFIAVGGTTSTDPNGDAYVVVLDDHGDVVATHTYGGAGSDGLLSITPVGAGYAACGTSLSFGGGRSRGYCVMLGADLAATSSNAYGGDDVTNLFDLAPVAGGGFISAGNTTDTDAWLDIVVRRHDAAGAELWKQYFGRSQDDTAFNVLAFADGSLLLSGFTGGWSGCQQYYAIKLDSAGAKLWDRTYGGCSSGNQVGWHQLRQALETPEHGFIATGSTVIDGARSVFLERFAEDGTSEWRKTYGGADNEYGAGLVATRDGGYAIVGWTRSFGAGGDDIYLIKTSADGTLQWQRTFGGAGDEQGLSILQLPDDGFMLGGTTGSWGAGGADLVVVRTDAEGNAPSYGQCNPACENGGTCIVGNACDCAGTGYFGERCQYSEAQYTTQWTKDTEPRVVALNADKTIGTVSWKGVVGAASYKVWRYNGANFARELVTSTTERTYEAPATYAYRVEAIAPSGDVLDFVNVGVQTIVPESWTTGTFFDDFSDDSLASNYLNPKPHQVSEANGYLQITLTVTDDYPAFYLPYDTQGRRFLKLTARLYQHWSNAQYTGGIFFFPSENSWKFMSFGSPWESYRGWFGGQLRHARYRGDPPSEDIYPIVSLDNVSRLDNWFDYEVTIDTVTGLVSGSLGGDTFPALLPVKTQFLPTGKVLIHFTCYGWFTGHFLRIDDLRVESYD